MKSAKNTYYGEFNWFGTIHKMYTKALTSDSAYRQFCARLAKTLRVETFLPQEYFRRQANSYKIRLIKPETKE